MPCCSDGWFQWIVGIALMVLTGFAALCLRDSIDGYLAFGRWHGLLSGLFVIIVWPALWWPLEYCRRKIMAD